MSKWIDRHEEFDEANTWECPYCHLVWDLDEGTPEENDMNFCPKCGHGMREESNEQTD